MIEKQKRNPWNKGIHSNPPNKIFLDETRLMNLYDVECFSILKISKIMNCSEGCVKRNLVEYGAIIRTISEQTMGRIPWNKGLTKETDERVAKIAIGVSKGRKGKGFHSPTEFKKGHKQIYTEERKEKQRQNMLKRMKENPQSFISKIEKDFARILDCLEVDYKTQYWIKGLKHPFDYALLEKKILIEVDGEYYHSKRFLKTVEKDKRINDFVETSEWRLIRISDTEVHDMLKQYWFGDY